MNGAIKNELKKHLFDKGLILGQIDALVCVADIDNCRILYLNKHAEKLYGDITGHTCWEKLRLGQTGPCEYCNNDLKSNDDSLPKRDELNPINNKWYEVHDKIIFLGNNRAARLQVAFDITKRKEDEINLKTLLRQQELFSNIALSFNQQKPFANKVNEVLSVIGKFVNTDRVSVYKNFSKNTKANLIYEWCNKNIITKINKIPPIVFDKYHSLYKEVASNNVLKISDVGSNKYYKSLKIFTNFNVKSMLLVPIFLHQNQFGFISFEECGKTREWYENEIKLIKTLGNIISTVFERKNLEEKRIRSENKLKIANNTKDRFLSIITHDLQTPFSDLKSLSSLLADSYDCWDDKKRKIFIDSILVSSSQGYNLLENLMVWSQIQSNQISFNPERVDVKSVISQTIENLQERADRKGIRISGVPENQMFVHVDYHMLNTVFYNLLNNAIKFSKKNGSIKIKFKLRKKYLELSVCDKGVGIKKEDQTKLFRIDIDQTTFGPPEEKGTGLGLIICKEYINRNGGKIWLNSSAKKGSEFTFTIPLSKK
ncbi:MAG: hypothetical protein B6I20_08770 [Bacteroidetes bacterium 4572_117]|nr:MAG: hypothetical protein B6I20_08770 [Bacteroidetes bacterium 4572_117]